MGIIIRYSFVAMFAGNNYIFNSTRIQMHPASRFRFFTDLNVICPSFTKWEYQIIYELSDYASSRTEIRDILIVNNTYVLRELRV